MDEFEKFAKDFEIYRGAMERFARQGITDKEKVIIEMEKKLTCTEKSSGTTK